MVSVFSRRRKNIIVVTVTLFVAGILAQSLFVPDVFAGAAAAGVAAKAAASAAKASGPGIPTIVTSDLPALGEKVELTIEKAMLASTMSALVQGASYFFRKLAYDTAVWVSHGGKGKGALAFQNGFGAYLGGVSKDATATLIGELGKPFGLNLCGIPDIELFAQIQIGLQRHYDNESSPKPSCRWSQLESSLFSSDAWEAKYGAEALQKSAERLFDNAFDVRQTDFGFTIEAMARIDRAVAREKEAALLDRQEGDGFKPVVNMIAGYIKTPGKLVYEETKTVTGKQQGEITASQIAGIYGSELLEVLPMAGSVFLNTLVGELLNKLLSDGLLPDPGGTEASAGVLDFYGQSLVDKKVAAEKAFNFLFTSVPQKQLSSYHVESEFLACPDKPGINNCVIDSSLHEALVRANNGTPLTIREALKENLLHADWLLISPLRVADNTNPKGCVVGKYCYSNIQKMRKVRILPLGFEIAASKSNPDQPWKLGDVVNGFEDCDQNGNPSPQHPYCHLIDPNWVLRVPDNRCEAKVYTSELLDPSTPNRRQECVDVSTCINEGPNGECLGQYGYCLKEKNIWQLPGQSCPAEFNTCKTFKTTDNQLVSYLSRTVDYGTCSAGSVGCSAYSADQINGAWTVSTVINTEKKKVGWNQSYYFNNKIKQYSCSSADEGCTAFYGASQISSGVYQKDTTKVVHLKKAPDYLGCYDTNPSTPTIEWPTTRTQLLNSVSTNPACDKFAEVCIAEEVGCQAYSPKSGGPDVPGVIGANVCAAECVGYDTYKQESTYFEPSAYPLYLIPKNGIQCSATQVGCDEFTNIESLSQGGEGKEYYTYIKQCEKPTGTNAKTYYSWEGSATEGYVLKVHNLLQMSAADEVYVSALTTLGTDTAAIKSTFIQGSPAYADDAASKLTEAYQLCNETEYNSFINNPTSTRRFDPDCRALYDEGGNIYYRLISRTVTVSPACRTLRKTVSNFYTDTELTTAPACEARSGNWVDDPSTVVVAPVCMRCTNGGKYQVDPITGQGACAYNAIPGQGESNTCSPQANGCREYTGNTGAYEKPIMNDGFEPAGADAGALEMAKAGWRNIGGGAAPIVVAESLQVGLRSLQVNSSQIEKEIATSTLEQGQWYELSFWARGNSQGLQVTFRQQGNIVGTFTFDPLTQTNTTLGVTNDWRQYTLGPAQFTGTATQVTTLQISRVTGSGSFYIDNVLLRRLEGKHYVIKDSWKAVDGSDVPLTCDANPTDALPGVALGCREYTEKTTNKTVYTTGFESLCREEAIGCQPVFDSHNTLDGEGAELTSVYHAFCQVSISAIQSATACERTIGVKKYSCTAQPGTLGCYIDGPVIVPSDAYMSTSAGNSYVLVRDDVTLSVPYANVDFLKNGLKLFSSSVVISADTSTSTPIFLTVRDQFLCKESARGCMKVGAETQLVPDVTKVTTGTYSYQDTYVRNDPALYSGTEAILCGQDQIGCSQFTSNNQTYFFKDPVKTGSTLCEYKPLKTENGIAKSGWYKVGVGLCSGTQNECTSNSNCAAGQTCQNIGNVACYSNPEYVLPGGSYGIYSNSSIGNYKGYVGTCNADYNGCTELVDPYDTGENIEGKPYYAIYDSNLTYPAKACEGLASLEEGCVLFNRTELPNKIYNADATYDASEYKSGDKYGLVAPVDGQKLSGTSKVANNANIILKVNRDRECSEWLDCRSSDPVTLPNGKTINVCLDYKACRESNGRHCEQFVETWDTPHVAKFLDEAKYISRDTSWFGEEYTGYSLFGKFPINDYQYLYLSADDQKDTKSFLGYRLDQNLINKADISDDDKIAAGCFKADGSVKDMYSSCGFDKKGSCLGTMCIYPVGGVWGSEEPVTQSNLETRLVDVSCKAFPEKDSPFSTLFAINPILGDATDTNGVKYDLYPEKVSGYQSANICQDGECSCNYTKITKASSLVTYWSNPPSQLNVLGACIGGSDDGDFCYEDKNCDGYLAGVAFCGFDEITSKSTHIGTQGYCLEKDRSRPIEGTDDFECLTWLPLDVNPVGIDTYNNFPEAGFDPTKDASTGWTGLYCTAATGKLQKDKQLESIDVSGVTYSSKKPVCSDGKPIGSLVGCVITNQNSSLYNPNKMTPVCLRSESYEEGAVINTYPVCGDWINESDVAYCLAYPIAQSGCSVSGLTFTGAKNTLDSVAKNGWSDQTLVELYNNGGYNNISNALYNCSTASSNSYGGLACGTDAKKLAKLLGTKENYVLLRAETGKQQPVYQDSSSFEGGVRTVLGNLLPSDAVMENQPLLDFNDNSAQSVSGRIILKHPPRIWDANKHTGLHFSTLSGNRASKYFGEDNFGPTFPVFDGVMASPGPYQYPQGLTNLDSYLYRSSYEAVMNLKELGKVYFIPLLYSNMSDKGPNCFNCDAPALLKKQIAIDFDAINSAGYSGQSNIEINRITESPGGDNWEDQNGLPANPNGTPYPFGLAGTHNGVQFDVLAYKIDREDGDKANQILDSHYSITGDEYYSSEFSSHIPTPGNSSPAAIRNKIQTRYVVVVYKNKGSLVVSAGQDPNTLEIDSNQARQKWLPQEPTTFFSNNTLLRNPFSEGDDADVGCYWDNSDLVGGPGAGSGTWFAIGMDFNKEGEFLGYVSRFCMAEDDARDPGDMGSQWCDDDNNDTDKDNDCNVGGLDTGRREEYGINLAVLAEVKNMCQDIASVLPTNNTDEPKAFTNRLWKGSWPQLVSQVQFGTYDETKNDPLLTWYMRPYGGLGFYDSMMDDTITNLKKDDKLELDMIDALVLGVDPTTEQSKGIPFICNLPAADSLFDNASLCEYSSRNYTLKLNNLFIKYFQKWKIKRVVGGDNQFIVDTVETNKDDSSTAPGFPPQIYSINPATCSDETTHCTAGEKDNFTISGKNGTLKDYNGDGISDEDPLNFGVPNPHIAVNSFFAKAQFFAFADDNRMPIDRILIDWNDNFITHEQHVGKYKNKKPYCGSAVGHCFAGSNNPTLLTCDTNSECTSVLGSSATCKKPGSLPGSGIISGKEYLDSFNQPRFGDSAERSCEDRPYEPNYVYYCSVDKATLRYNSAPGVEADNISNLPANEKELLKQMGYDYTNPEVAGKLVCIFKPRIQVRDTWGWCNGACSDHNGDGKVDLNDGCAYYGPNPQNSGQITNQCNLVGSPYPWTSYQGRIIVVPRQ